MRPTWKVLVLVLTLALAAPATVLAQSAGDEQYVDPFEGQGNGGGGGGGGNGGNDGSQAGSDDGTTTTAQTAPNDTAGVTDQGTTSESTGATLPRTGLDLTPVLLAGIFLFGAGFLIRQRTGPVVAARAAVAPAFAPPSIAAPPALPPAAPIQRVATGAATPPHTGAPVIGLGLVGLFILGTVLRRRA